MMSTTYVISLGYQSGYSGNMSKSEAWEKLRTAALKIANQPMKLYTEAMSFEAPSTCPCGCGATLMEHCDIYRAQDGNPLIINEEDKTVVQLASGQRELKEHVRRAFCRLVMYAMHRQGIEINIEVV